MFARFESMHLSFVVLISAIYLYKYILLKRSFLDKNKKKNFYIYSFLPVTAI